MNLMEHLQPHVYIPLKIGGIEISISNAVVAIWIASFLVFLTLTLAGRAGRLVPKGMQNFMETLVQFARQTLVVEILGEEGIAWFPFIATLFFFILYCNLLGLVPYFPGFTPTSNIWVTASLAVVLFANMTAGHLVIMVFISMIFMISAFITPVSVVMAVVMMAFEIFVCVLQAFIFAILASIYISLAVHAEH